MDDMMLSIGNPTRTNKLSRIHMVQINTKSQLYFCSLPVNNLKGNQENIPIYNNIFKNKVPRNKFNPGD